MIDLHSHIIHGVDDGAESAYEALAMCRMAAAYGTRIIAATPHSPASVASYAYSTETIKQQVAELQQKLNQEGIDLQVLVGTEIRFSAEMIEQLRSGQLLTYNNSNLILLEVPNDAFAHDIEQAVFVAQAAGYRVIVPHPERCIEVQDNPHILKPLIERGAAMQITAAAIIGEQGRQLKQTANTLLEYGYAHIIASDAHGLAPKRTTQISVAHEYIAKQYSDSYAQTLTEDNPLNLLENKPLVTYTPQGKRFWQKLRS